MEEHTNIWLFAVTILVIIVSVLCIYYMYVFKKSNNLERAVNIAVSEAEFKPNIFKIYDRSVGGVCDRLIVVEPFSWFIWACRGELYILNPERGIKCGADSTPAVRVLPNQFVETCLYLDYQSLLSMYMLEGQTPTIVPYEFEGTTFTVLSALNILMKKYLTFDTDVTLVQENNTDSPPSMRIVSRRRKRSVGSDKLNDYTKAISDKNVVQLMGQSTDHQQRKYTKEELHSIYVKQLENIDAYAEYKHSADGSPPKKSLDDVSDSKSIAARQHLLDEQDPDYIEKLPRFS